MLQVLHTGGYGACRWCGEQVGELGGTTAGNRLWHPECLHIFELHAKPKVQQVYLEARDGFGCTICGEPAHLEPFHVVPLADASAYPDIMDRIDLYGPDNLQLRCPAHR